MKRVLVISKNDLLVIGIERLLGPSQSYSIEQSCVLDEADIRQQIQHMGLDVIIVESKSDDEQSASLNRLLNFSKQLRVLTLEVNSNQVQIYDKREVQLHVSEDLLSYI